MVVVVVCFNPCFVVPFKTVFAFALGFPVFALGFPIFSAGCHKAKRRLFACGS